MKPSDERILVTGATGFVGKRLCDKAFKMNWPVRKLVRSGVEEDDVVVVEIGPDTSLSRALTGVQTVVHLAARVHVMGDRAANPLAEFRRVNVYGTANLARQAADAGVKRFVFISTVKVHGESTLPGRPFIAGDVPGPQDPYAISKHEAEQALGRVAGETGLEVVIIRPPLVYGPGVKANFLRMMQWVDKALPLPLASVDNRRSLVALDNLVDLILTCLSHPAAAGKTFLVSDADDLSTPELIRQMAGAMGRPARLFPVAPMLLRLSGRLVGRAAEVERLIGSLQVDIGYTCRTLGWRPPVPVDEGLREAARNFLMRPVPEG